jgi:hypothetical protein
MVLGKRSQIDTVVESCYYLIKPQADIWTGDSFIYIYLNQTATANMYVYSGNNRRNASLVIENNSTLEVGSPIRIPISSQAIVVL